MKKDVKLKRMQHKKIALVSDAWVPQVNGVLYCNDGDWIESCTALVEDEVGNLSILNWPEEREKLKLVSLEERRKIKEDAA